MTVWLWTDWGWTMINDWLIENVFIYGIWVYLSNMSFYWYNISFD
jgi:hypothetical protein